MDLILFGDLIARAREAEGLTQLLLAHALGWHVNSISRIESNQAPTQEDEASLYRFFGVVSFDGLVKKYGSAKKKRLPKMTPKVFLGRIGATPEQVLPFMEIVAQHSKRGRKVHRLADLSSFWMILLSVQPTKTVEVKPQLPKVAAAPKPPFSSPIHPKIAEPEPYRVCNKCRHQRPLKLGRCPEDGTPL